MLRPGNISKNLFEPLDGKIDLTTPLWKDIAGVVEDFSWKNKHYYYRTAPRRSTRLTTASRPSLRTTSPIPTTCTEPASGHGTHGAI